MKLQRKALTTIFLGLRAGEIAFQSAISCLGQIEAEVEATLTRLRLSEQDSIADVVGSPHEPDSYDLDPSDR